MSRHAKRPTRHAKPKERLSLRNRLFGTALVGAIGGLAFSVLSPAEVSVETVPKVAAEAPATPTPSPKVESPTPTPSQPEVPYIDISRPELPQSMSMIVDATVEIVGDVPGTDRVDFGSGTILDVNGTNVIMTAGHVVQAANGECTDSTISYPATSYEAPTSGYYEAVTPSEHIVDYADGTDSYDAFRYNHKLDASVIIPKKQDLALQDIFAGRPSMTVQKKVDVKPGDRVFAAGYGPRPNENPNPLSDKRVEREAEVIPGTVLEQEGDKITFITGIDGYGMRPDNRVRPGDSGGTFIDSKGNYLGDTIATGVHDRTGEELEELYNVDLPKGTEKQEFSWAVAQVIDQSTLSALMHKTVECY